MNRIVVKRELVPKIKLIEVENAGIAAKSRPGQFVVLHLSEKGEKFPLTIAGANPSEGTIKLVFNEVGKSTQQLGTFNVGEEISSVAGPLGNPTAMENFGTVVCFGGGVMIGPLAYEVAAFRKVGNKVITVIGARMKELLIFKEELRALSDEFYVCTDDGSEGHQGLDFLREVFEKGKVDRVLIMSVSTATLKAVSEITRSYGVKTIVSLTPLMLDGTGMCGCCRVSIGSQTKFACIDGPEFDGHEVDWELLEARKRMYSSEERISSLSYETFSEEFAFPKEMAWQS